MSLAAGTKLGPYEILSPLGAGGMGEVYRARDTRLERTVAVKVLPERLSSSPEVRQRFEREAKTISQLSHPHICALYDVGRENDVEFLVMEYLEGETLLDRLAKGPLPLEQTLRFGQEIAGALDKAHRQGIVHRDLKPGNVMLTKSGVKLLDFGLAKAIAAPATNAELTSLPTQQGLTQEGTILGTFQYMAPEQLEGKEADARADIFAFGCALYEMATGRKAFSGSSQASLISAIMKEEPTPISSVEPMSPPALDRVVAVCLAKDPEDRWQSAHDLGNELRWIQQSGSASSGVPAAVPRRASRRDTLIRAAALLLLLSTAVLAIAYARRSAPPRRRAVLQALVPPNTTFSGFLAMSPDGSHLAFCAIDADGTSSVWVRPLDSLAARRLSGTEGALLPFWSADSRSIGFFADNKLKTMEIAGSAPPQVLSEGSGDPRGGAWGPDGTIVYAPTFQGPLLRVRAGGGKPSSATSLVEGQQTHRYPWFLPDGRHFLYYASKGSGQEPGEICVGSLDDDPTTCVLTSSSLATFVAPGYLLFSRGATLMAQPFNPASRKLSGKPAVLAEQVTRNGTMSGYRAFSPAVEGPLAYHSGGVRSTRLVWLDRGGKELGTLGAPGDHYAPRISPDDSRMVEAINDPNTTVGDLWLTDLTRNLRSRFTFDSADDSLPVWSRDGKWIYFQSSREAQGVANIYRALADRPGSEELVLRSDIWKAPDDVSPDGKWLAFEALDPKTRNDLWLLPLEGDPKPRPLVVTPFGEFSAQFSPDGKWFAYVSAASGRQEVYVQAFPGPGGKWQVSDAGGISPQWSRDGRELFYVAPDGRLMSVPVRLSPSFEAGPPVALFKATFLDAPDRQYHVSADGKRFLVNRLSAGSGLPMTVMLDWSAGLETK